jgi:hypothetical protein
VNDAVNNSRNNGKCFISLCAFHVCNSAQNGHSLTDDTLRHNANHYGVANLDSQPDDDKSSNKAQYGGVAFVATPSDTVYAAAAVGNTNSTEHYKIISDTNTDTHYKIMSRPTLDYSSGNIGDD